MNVPLTAKPDATHQCILHKIHVPKPMMLHGHHIIPLEMQRETGKDVADDGNIAWVCPTGHYNVHEIISELLRGKTRLGRKGVTGQLADRAVDWYKDNR